MIHLTDNKKRPVLNPHQTFPDWEPWYLLLYSFIYVSAFMISGGSFTLPFLPKHVIEEEGIKQESVFRKTIEQSDIRKTRPQLEIMKCRTGNFLVYFLQNTTPLLTSPRYLREVLCPLDTFPQPTTRVCCARSVTNCIREKSELSSNCSCNPKSFLFIFRDLWKPASATSYGIC